MLLLSAVPAVVLHWWRREERPVGLRRALQVGVGAGLAVTAIGVAMPFAARAALPVEVLHALPNQAWNASPGFLGVYHNTYTAVAVLAQAAAAGIVAASRIRLRPVLVPVTVTMTTVLATMGLYASRAVSSCIKLTGDQPTTLAQPCDWRLLLLDSYLGHHYHSIISWGAIAAVFAALVGAVARALLNRRVGPAPDRVVTRRPGRSAVVALGEAPGHYQHWKPNPPPIIPELGPTVADPCVVGAWREVAHEVDMAPFGSQRYRFTGSGTTQTFRADGTAVVDHGTGVVSTATVDGRRVTLTRTGRTTTRYAIRDGIIAYHDTSSDGTETWRVDGAVRSTTRPGSFVSFPPDRYRCVGDTMVQEPAQNDVHYRIELRKIGG
jgi:hypothetical protein